MIFEDWFIKLDKIDILSENHRDTDLFDWWCYVDKFTDKIKLFKKNTIMWFIGDFWNWKSTFLNQVIKKVDKDIKWIEFNARKYPDRKDLWENFILECAISINKSEFYEVLSKIDWTKWWDKKKLIELWSEFLSTITNIKAFDHIKHFGHFFNDTPVKRVFQLELTLKEILSKIEEPIINIIIEDIDRSGDSWIYFLETLHYFINENEIAAKLINIIVPIWSTKYRENLDHYGKCLDIVHDFKTNFLKFDWFIKELFDDSIINDNRLFSQLCSFFAYKEKKKF